LHEAGDTGKSSALFATDRLAIPDDNDASGRGLLIDGSAIIGVLARRGGASPHSTLHPTISTGRECAAPQVIVGDF
jgi:hypothetical protein